MRSTLKLGIAVAILASTALLYRRFTTTESIPEATTTDATTADAPATATTDATGE